MGLTAFEQRLREAIEMRADSLRADLERFVNIPTGMGHAPGLDETRGLLGERLSALGASLSMAPGDERPAWIGQGAPATTPPPMLIARRPGGGRCRILLCGHLDTVHDPAGPFRTLTFSSDGKTARGPGCVDMKGGLVVAVHALEALASLGVDVSWGFLLNSDEETGSYHSDAAMQREAKQYDVGLVFEPALPDGSLVIERPGSGQFYIETRGIAAHVGRDFASGRSAILLMSECVQRVHDAVDLDRGIILNVGVVRGGTATNVVPEKCEAWGNARYRSEPVAAGIRANLDALARTGEVRVEHAFNRPAKPETPGVRSLALLARAAAEDLGQRLPFGKTGGVCDGNGLQAAGLPTIDTLGVRGGGLHTPDEWIELASLVERCQLTALLLARLAEQGFTTPSAT